MQPHEINELLEKGKIVKIKTHRGTFQITHVKPLRSTVLIDLTNGTKILMSKRKFVKSQFIIKQTNEIQWEKYDLNEIREVMTNAKRVIYRGKTIADVEIIENRIILRATDGTKYTLTPNRLLEYNVFIE
jgi:hypothetical protein